MDTHCQDGISAVGVGLTRVQIRIEHLKDQLSQEIARLRGDIDELSRAQASAQQRLALVSDELQQLGGASPDPRPQTTLVIEHKPDPASLRFEPAVRIEQEPEPHPCAGSCACEQPSARRPRRSRLRLASLVLASIFVGSGIGGTGLWVAMVARDVSTAANSAVAARNVAAYQATAAAREAQASFTAAGASESARAAAQQSAHSAAQSAQAAESSRQASAKHETRAGESARAAADHAQAAKSASQLAHLYYVLQTHGSIGAPRLLAQSCATTLAQTVGLPLLLPSCDPREPIPQPPAVQTAKVR